MSATKSIANAAFAKSVSADRALAAVDAFPALPFSRSRVKRVAVVGDSFVGGAGASDPKSFAYTLAAALRARYGDAGFGYLPVFDGKMASFSKTAGFATVSNLTGGTSSYRWDDARKRLMFNGLGYYRDGGAGDTDSNHSISYTPSASDAFTRGVAETWTSLRVHFVLRSANAGFQLRQSNINQNSATNYGSGATLTGSTSGTVLTASAVTGVIPRSGSRIIGGVTASTVTFGGGSNKGGAGTYNINETQTVGSQAMTADANIQPILNTPQSVMYYSQAGGNAQLQMLGTYGDVVITGVEWYNGNAGVTVTDFGSGGSTAYQYASLDDAAQRRHWQNADFDLAIVVLGMNDRTVFDPGVFAGSLATLVGRIQACPRTQVLIVRCTDSSDAATSNLSKYDSVMQGVASAMGCGYLDMRNASASLANYATANAAGLMLDTVHLNPTGNALVGAYIDSFLKL